MVIIHGKAKRKPSGGRYTACRPKRRAQKGSMPTHTKVGEQVAKNSKTKGGGLKTKLLFADKVNLLDPATRKYSIESIKTVLENPANRHFVRRNIMTHGTIIETSKGKARVTGRPGQEGMVNAVLIK
ncbi:30S ribosomal protein S8e [Candidatus Woesearchaeota archaeon]|nr:30S ribosomal protein S8e [Candidatus Woesearchaeota archaeon]